MRRGILVGLAALLLAGAPALAEERTRSYGGSGADRLTRLIEYGDGLIAVGRTDSRNGDLAMRTRRNQAGWMLCLNGEGAPLWSYCTAKDGRNEMSAPFAHENGQISAVLTGRGIDGLEWLIVSGEGRLAQRRTAPAVETVCAGAKRVAVLEDVMNPTNVGAIFRSAAALGIDAVLLTQACSDPLYRRAIRVSMGTVFQVPWTYLPEGWPQTLRALGFTTAAMALCDASLPIYAPQLKRADRLAVVLGTEGDGLAESTIAACDCTVRIPMTHGVDSLNVAAASAVAFYQLALLAGLSETED